MNTLGFDRFQMHSLLPSYHASPMRQAMNKAEFERAVSQLLGFTYSANNRATADLLYQAFDFDGNGMVDWREFHVGMAMLCQGTMEDRLALAFKMFDKNGSGFIEEYELRMLLRMLAGPWDMGRVERLTQQFMTQGDWSGDRRLSWAEFRRSALAMGVMQLMEETRQRLVGTLQGQQYGMGGGMMGGGMMGGGGYGVGGAWEACMGWGVLAWEAAPMGWGAVT